MIFGTVVKKRGSILEVDDGFRRYFVEGKAEVGDVILVVGEQGEDGIYRGNLIKIGVRGEVLLNVLRVARFLRKNKGEVIDVLEEVIRDVGEGAKGDGGNGGNGIG